MSAWRPLRLSWQMAVLSVVIFAAALVSTATGLIPAPNIDVFFSLDEGGGYSPQYRWKAGTQIVMVYIGASSCGAANDASLPEAIEEMKVTLSAKAEESGYSFAVVGVALDWEVWEGLRYLRKFGAFDEVAAGYRWANAAALKYIYEDIVGVAATPQVVVVERNLQLPNSDSGVTSYAVSDERMMVRKVGLIEISRWVRNGMPLPQVAR